MTTLYILSGISFAGKSVLAKAINSCTQSEIVDPDQVAHEFGLGLNGEFLSDAEWSVFHSIAEGRAREFLNSGVSVIYDTTSFTKSQRDHLKQIAYECNANAQVIFVRIPEEVALKRWELNSLSKERFHVHFDDFNMIANQFEPPYCESEITYNAEEDLPRWLQENLGC